MPDDATPTRRTRRRRHGGASADHARPNPERALRDLTGSGPSQVGVEDALRARDVNRPTDDELAEAERTTRIVRRNWRPDESRR